MAVIWTEQVFRDTYAGTIGLATYGAAYASCTSSGTQDAVLLAVEFAALSSGGSLDAYRFRADDGDESSATWLSGNSLDVAKPAGEQVRLRMQVTTPQAGQYKLEVARNGTTDWSVVGVKTWP